MKLQELLNNYKDKVYNGIYDYILFFEETNEIEYIYHQEDGKQVSINKSLSDLLFSTPFLSLLERKKGEGYLYWIKQDDQGKIKNIYYDERYHRINLSLLTTDAERIEYIEKFTL